MKKIKLLAFLLLLALPALAGTKTIDEVRQASPDAKVNIELIAGDVRIVPWDRDEVRVRGTINDEYEEFEMSGEGDAISIEVEPPRGNYRDVRLDADLEVSVPYGVRLSFESISADLALDDLTGSVRVETISGAIELRGPLQEIEADSVSGKIEIDAESTLRSVECETVSGNIEFTGEVNPSSQYSFESVTGAITLRLPVGAAADYEIETFSGDIRNEFGPKARKTSDFLPAKSLSFSAGSGGARIRATSFSGVVRLVED